MFDAVTNRAEQVNAIPALGTFAAEDQRKRNQENIQMEAEKATAPLDDQNHQVEIKDIIGHHDVNEKASLASKFPRLYYFFVQLVLPLEICIGMSILFGWGLATLESAEEMFRNDASIVERYSAYDTYVARKTALHAALAEAPETCLVGYNQSIFPTETGVTRDVLHTLLTCAANQAEMAHEDIFLSLEDYIGTQLPLTFYWTNCPRDYEVAQETKSIYLQQSSHYLNDWLRSFQQRFYELKETTPGNLSHALTTALDEATGSEQCSVHTAGGALFWFTFMTTIGYGDETSLSSDGGRYLVYTFGFISIMACLALNGAAGFILMTIIDDFLHRIRMSRFTKGPLAVLFWLCLFVSWSLVVALSAWGFMKNQTEFTGFTLSDSYWFAYITLTTVGLGDYYIPHEVFTIGDMVRQE
jgi:Ion channel